MPIPVTTTRRIPAISVSIALKRAQSGPGLRGVLCKEPNGIADGYDGFGLIVGNLDPELLSRRERQTDLHTWGAFQDAVPGRCSHKEFALLTALLEARGRVLSRQALLENAVYHGIEPSDAPGVVSINIFYKGGEVHAILRNPYQAVSGGGHHAGNKMALGNIRERLQLHFDAEGALESRVRDATYEVHIRMPYRTTKTGTVRGHDAVRPAGVASAAIVSRRESEERTSAP